MGRDLLIVFSVKTMTRFNPRARMGRDIGDKTAPRLQGVSIHAPAWGATTGYA